MKFNSYRCQILICIILISFSCSAPLPQIPSNKNRGEDSVSTALIKLNTQYTEQEDSLLQNYVSLQKVNFRKHLLGFWYSIDTFTKGSTLKKNQNCTIEVKYLTLVDKLIEEKKLSIKLGKKQIIKGLEEGLQLMTKGETATFIIPSYLGYGMKGNGTNIGPYTSLKIRVHVLNCD